MTQIIGRAEARERPSAKIEIDHFLLTRLRAEAARRDMPVAALRAPATRLVASKIIEFAQSGVLEVARLRSMTRKEFKLE